jgi:hypothetical protein
MVKKLNPSFVEYFATYLKGLLTYKENNPETVITAEMFQDQVTNAANVYLNKNYGIDAGGVRSAIAQSTPEAECANAIKARGLHNIEPKTDNRISEYKTQAQIYDVNLKPGFAAAELEKAKTKYKIAANNEQGIVVNEWTSKTNMLLYDANAKKMRQQPVPFNIESAVYCGNCWICNTDVMSYTGTSTEEHQTEKDLPAKEFLEGTTPCGDCEHVSAIMASYIAGMLKSGGFAQFYWASYYVACVECNRKKSNYIGVRLHATRGWEVDADGVEAILNAIFSKNTVKIHESEYNPIRNALTNKYNIVSFAEKEDFRASVRANITSGTQTWCEAANKSMTKGTAQTKHLKMAFNVSKIIVAITGHLKVITGPLEKKAKKRNAESKVVKVARPGPKSTGPGSNSTGKRPRGGAPPPDQAFPRLVSNPLPPPPPLEGQESDKKNDVVMKTMETANRDEKNDVVMKTMETANHDEDDYIMQWNNLLENEFDDDDENDETEYVVKLETEETILTYIGEIYGPRLFAQYELDPAIFNELMVNLSTSMKDMMNVSKQGQVASSSSQSFASGETTVFEFGKKGEQEAYASSTPPGTPGAVKSNQVTPVKSNQVTPAKTPTVGENEDTQLSDEESTDDTKSTNPDIMSVSQKEDPDPEEESRFTKKTDPADDQTAKKARQDSSAVPTPIPFSPPRTSPRTSRGRGGSRLNKSHSKHRTKRISYIKHKQTRKNTQTR